MVKPLQTAEPGFLLQKGGGGGRAGGVPQMTFVPPKTLLEKQYKQ